MTAAPSWGVSNSRPPFRADGGEAAPAKRSIAIHEAAHLVAAYLLSHEVTAVDVDPPPAAGEHLAGFITHRRRGADPFSSLVVASAGYAVDTLSAHADFDSAWDRASGDRVSALRAAKWLDPRPEDLVWRAEALARQLLARHGRAVHLLADRLMTTLRMEGDGLRDAIEAALHGMDRTDWIIRRRQVAEAAGPDGFRAAWDVFSSQWHRAASDESRERYDTTWHAQEERRLAELIARREEIQARAGQPLTPRAPGTPTADLATAVGRE